MKDNKDMFHGSIFNYLSTWLLMIPLAYYSGAFWPFSSRSKDAVSASYGTLALTPQSFTYSLAVFFTFCIAAILVVSSLKYILHAYMYYPYITAVVLLSFASVLWSQDPIRSINYSACLLLNMCLVFYVHKKYSSDQVVEIIFIIGAICLIASIYYTLLFPQYGQGASGRWRGVYGNADACSMETVLFMSTALFVSKRSLFRKIIVISYVLISMFVVVMTGCATGWILIMAMAICVMLGKLIGALKKKDRICVMFICIAVIAVATYALVENYEQITVMAGKDATMSNRTVIWQYAFSSILKRPFLGYGYASFWLGAQKESANLSLQGINVPHAHNGYIETCLEVGITGLIIFLLSFLSAFKNSIICIINGNISRVLWYIIIVITNAILCVSESAGSPQANSLPYFMFAIACVGLSYNAKRLRRYSI